MRTRPRVQNRKVKKKMIKEQEVWESSGGTIAGGWLDCVAGPQVVGGGGGAPVERAVPDPMDRQCQSGPCTGVVGWRLLADGQKA